MLAVRIDLLTGRYVATRFNDRNRAEWPPHPARFFSALVATVHEREPVDPWERTALEWLQRQEAPEIAASDAYARDVREHYVWPNDYSVFAEDGERLVAAERELADRRNLLAVARQGRQPVRELRRLEREAEKAVRIRDRIAERIDGESDEALKKALGVVRLDPEGRKPRTFPSVTPDDPVVHLIWRQAEPEAVLRSVLGALVARVTRIGHSSSLAHCAVVDSAPPGSWIPDELGTEVLRVPTSSQLALLEQEFGRHRGESPRVLPRRDQPYRRARPSGGVLRPINSVFGLDWIVYERLSGPPISVTRAADVGRALRGALMANAEEQPPPEVIAGHRPDGAPAERPRVAFVALPYVGHRHADGTLLCAAVVLPGDLGDEDRRRVFRAAVRWERGGGRRVGDDMVVDLWMGRAGDWTLRRGATADLQARNLNPETWAGPRDGAARWGSVTPVVLDRFPGNLRSRHPETAARAYAEAEEAVAESCGRIGLPRPVCVEILGVSPVPGAPPAFGFPAFSSHPGSPARIHVHVRIEFPSPVRGPVLLGAGRYRGLGLCRPLGDREAHA